MTRQPPLQARTSCPRCGCDLRVIGAIEEPVPGKFRCRNCRQTSDRERHRKAAAARPPRTHCLNGHPYNDQNSRIVMREGREWRYCVVCHKQGNALRALGRAKQATNRPPLALSMNKAEEVLQLVEERDRAATHWERAELQERIEGLLRTRARSGAGRSPALLTPTTGG